MKINRRQLLNLTLFATTAIIIKNLQQNSNQDTLWANELKPQIYKSKNGLLEVELIAQETPVNIDGKTAYLLTYNGQIPAPRLEAKAGDKVKIKFTNKLAQPTNIHYHGLHISPTGNADNAFLEIQPNQTFNYEFTIPDNHPSMTAWYHPHLHGYTAQQLSGGLAGLFIIKGELDDIPEINSAKEEFIVLQDFPLDNNGRLTDSRMMSLMMGREGDVITVNGEIKPQISLNKGEWLRLRILNASTSRFYNLSLDDNPFYLIATDGGAIASPQEMTRLLLTPGQRAEIMIKGENKQSSLKLINLPYNRGGMGMMGNGMMGGGMMGRRNNNSSQILATINLNQSNQNNQSVSLPNQLNTITALPSPSQVRRFTLNHGMANGMAFLINGKSYNHQRIDTEVKLNTVEEWELINTGMMDHPFHIHVNSFQVISRNDIPENLLAWRDTVLVKRGERVKIRIRFDDFTGKTVYHCHILDHEDLGMMGNLQINSE
ncbi:multicopper oxidase family protein [Cyanobacterium aponinum AL20118]|uniref:Multicopper oxidase family protein n=1 Tax=Cyanobacterium aponinum AL20115 TaxID=3090662 RepID=A0AAF1C3M9_9CHRO|nr:multicopper oxidase family protein [Cyanobacterium aponinum]WPF90038.1 multicopper oxidase family protein [Cyanobacterium aponinum AL20115]